MHSLLALALALAPAPVPTPTDEPAAVAPEDDPAARAARHFSAGEFLEAADAFEEAFERTGDPAFVFGRAQALRRAGNCAAAIDVFERFIALGPPPSDVEEAQKVIDACRRVLGIDDPVAPPPTPIADTSPAEPAPPPKRRWYADPAGDALFVSGLVVAALGGGLLGGSYVRARDRASESESDWDDRENSARAMSISGVVLLATGGALLLGSVIRFAVVARRERVSARASVDARALVVHPRFSPRGTPVPRLGSR